MSSKIIFSWKATGGGSRVSGRICASDMNDATGQAVQVLKELGLKNMSVNISQLKNQSKAMKEWEQKGKPPSSKPYDETM